MDGDSKPMPTETPPFGSGSGSEARWEKTLSIRRHRRRWGPRPILCRFAAKGRFLRTPTDGDGDGDERGGSFGRLAERTHEYRMPITEPITGKALNVRKR
jgi:hypothetical protein